MPGVYRLAKGTAIRHADEVLQYQGTAMTVPEVVPGTMLKGLDGQVVKGDFKIGGKYVCHYIKSAKKPAVLSITGTGMAVPFHMIVRDWQDAMQKGARACEAFEKGEAAPEEGVFRHIGSQVSVKWPGTH